MMMKNILKKYFLFLILCTNSLLAFSQSDGLSTWFAMRVNHRFNDRFLMLANAELRVDDTFSQVDRWGLALYGEYRIWSFLRVEGGYEVHHRDRGSAGWKFRQRYSVGAQANARCNRIRLTLRERMQQTFDHGKIQTEFRTRAEVMYEPVNSIFNPYFSFEIYQDIGNHKTWDVDRFRYRPGVNMRFTDHWALDFFYCYQQVPRGADKNIIGLECAFSF